MQTHKDTGIFLLPWQAYCWLVLLTKHCKILRGEREKKIEVRSDLFFVCVFFEFLLSLSV